MQKKFGVISLVVVLALALSACSSSATATTAATAVTTAAASSDSSLDDVANQSLQLAVGVINLRNSQTQIDATQAATLIPLFQSLQTLLAGTYDASQVQSSVDAIKAALTADQVQAISDMGTLTLDNLTMGGPNGKMEGTPDASMAQGTPGAGGPGNGQAPEGTPGAGGPGGGGQAPEGTPGAGGQGGGPGNGQGGSASDMQGTPAADNGGQTGESMQTILDNIKASTLAPGLNPDLIGLVITNLQMIK